MIFKSEGNMNEDQSKRGKKPFIARIACFRIVDVFSPLLSVSMEQNFFLSLTSPLQAIPHCMRINLLLTEMSIKEIYIFTATCNIQMNPSLIFLLKVHQTSDCSKV